MSSGESLDEIANKVGRELSERLGPDGWTIRALPSRPPRVEVRFTHPLAEIGLSFDSTKDYAAHLEQFFESQRGLFEVVAKAPRNAPHAELMRAVLENSRGQRWPDSVVERLALIFRSREILTEEEAAWFEHAGRNWWNREPPA